ncbi:MAG TPA: hypothetical protein VFX28_17675, partial [Methylomirabilota bacterium]|nr:hypothetical protein [Methylomirabilota bacterium]
GEPRRSEVAARRRAYVEAALATLRAVDPHGRPGDELLSAANLLLGMLNGIATRPFVRSRDDARALAARVGALFLYGFLDHAADGSAAGVPRTEARHDA